MAISILVILVTAALIGLKVLSVFSISLDVFRIVGGMIIAYMGFDMLRGSHTVGQAPPPDDDASVQSSLTPLIMFAAGPGTITTVVTLAAVHTPDGLPVTAIVAAVVGAAVTFVARPPVSIWAEKPTELRNGAVHRLDDRHRCQNRLLRTCSSGAPSRRLSDRKWIADFTYVWTAEG